MRTRALVLGLIALAFMIPSASGQFGSGGIKSCGDMDLFIANPDMRDVSSDGKYHVAGDFFMQFQVQGDGASEIESFGFSVGIPPENPPEICETPEPAPMWAGFMLESYKADFDKSDGFFILMSTTTEATPQNTDLTVSVHAYNAAGVEKARFWTTAVVESCGSPTEPIVQGGCTEEEIIANDNIEPWPMILPGDGPQNFVDGIYIDFAEKLAEGSPIVFLNGEDITAQLTAMDGAARKQWDDDIYYDRGPAGAGSTLTDPCDGRQTCKPAKGPAFEWTKRKMTPDDIVRVEATDLAGNSVVKEIHMAQAAFGGAIEGGIPILEMTFNQVAMTGAPGDELRFAMEMENTGSGEGHPFAYLQEGETFPTGWAEPAWDPGHSPVPPKGSSSQEFVITVPDNAEDGVFQFKPRMDYKQAGVDKSVQSVLSVTVEAPTDLDPNSGVDEVQDAPAVGFVLALLAVAGVALLRSRP